MKTTILNDLRKHLKSWLLATIELNPEDEFEWQGLGYCGNLRLNTDYPSLLPTIEIQLLDTVPLAQKELLKLPLDILLELNNTVLGSYKLTNTVIGVFSSPKGGDHNDQWFKIQFNGYTRALPSYTSDLGHNNH